MRIFTSLFLCLILCACNSVHMVPHTLDKTAMIYSPRGGYSMRRSVKEVLQERGYNLNIGSLRKVEENNDFDTEKYDIPSDTKYYVRVNERRETLRPIWCVFNGFWWWNFNMSIIDRTSNQEILSWRGRGCQNSSIRKLNRILDELEIPQEN